MCVAEVYRCAYLWLSLKQFYGIKRAFFPSWLHVRLLLYVNPFPDFDINADEMHFYSIQYIF